MKPGHLERCQIETPSDVVTLMWRLIASARIGGKFSSVLDLGAGDGRFARSTQYDEYIGIEMDPEKASKADLPANARIVTTDVLDWSGKNYDLAIGNPPYIKHHGLSKEWKSRMRESIIGLGGPSLKGTANLFIMFLTQSILRTKTDGLVAQLIPYEWVSRPSAEELRDFIKSEKWNVTILRFDEEIFPTVLTTASVTIIDKSKRDGQWSFGQITRTGKIRKVPHESGSSSRVLAYEKRKEHLHAIRGLSPGGQSIFVLTEQERKNFGLHRRRDVAPCVTSLRHLDESQKDLTKMVFESVYVEAGRRCWLIRSDKGVLSERLRNYLNSVGERWKDYSTCRDRSPWWKYKIHPVPQILVSSGFTKRSPKALVNSVGAVAVGSVYGVVTGETSRVKTIARKLKSYNFQRRMVHHSNNLRKIEVRQLNAVLNEIAD